MQQFRLRQEEFKNLKRQILFKKVPLLIVACGVGSYIGMVNTNKSEWDGVYFTTVMLVAIAIAMWGVSRGMSRSKRIYETYTMAIGNNTLIREQSDTPTISISYDDIQEILKDRKGNIIIKGKVENDLICIPYQIERYNEIDILLNDIKPVSEKKSALIQKVRSLISIVVIAAMLAVYTLSNKVVVFIAGTVAAGILSWSVYEIRRSKNIDSYTRRKSLWSLLVILSIIVTMYYKLQA